MEESNKQKLIGVIGGRKATPLLLKEAERIGEFIAQKKAVLICGGLSGVMEASARGAKAKGGLTVGIIPHDHIKEVNKFIDIPIVTGMGIGRNVIIARTADVLIAISGEYGTLSEIAFALQLGKAVIGIGTWDVKGVIPAKNAEDAMKKALKSLRAK